MTYMLTINEEQRAILEQALEKLAPSHTDEQYELYEMICHLPTVENESPGVIHDLTA